MKNRTIFITAFSVMKVPSLRITEIKDEMRYILEETDYQ